MTIRDAVSSRPPAIAAASTMLFSASRVRIRAVDAVEEAIEAKVFNNALRVHLSLRGRDKQTIATRAQLVERRGDADGDLVSDMPIVS